MPSAALKVDSKKNAVTHMKTTLEIADNLLVRAKARARKITLRAMIEEALATTLDQPLPTTLITPVTFKGKGLSRDFDGASWERIRDTIY